MKCLIIDAVHSAIAEELGKYMQVDTKMLPTQDELAALIPEYDVLIMRAWIPPSTRRSWMPPRT